MLIKVACPDIAYRARVSCLFTIHDHALMSRSVGDVLDTIDTADLQYALDPLMWLFVGMFDTVEAVNVANNPSDIGLEGIGSVVSASSMIAYTELLLLYTPVEDGPNFNVQHAAWAATVVPASLRKAIDMMRSGPYFERATAEAVALYPAVAIVFMILVDVTTVTPISSDDEEDLENDDDAANPNDISTEAMSEAMSDDDIEDDFDDTADGHVDIE